MKNRLVIIIAGMIITLVVAMSIYQYIDGQSQLVACCFGVSRGTDDEDNGFLYRVTVYKNGLCAVENLSYIGQPDFGYFDEIIEEFRYTHRTEETSEPPDYTTTKQLDTSQHREIYKLTRNAEARSLGLLEEGGDVRVTVRIPDRMPGKFGVSHLNYESEMGRKNHPNMMKLIKALIDVSGIPKELLGAYEISR